MEWEVAQEQNPSQAKQSDSWRSTLHIELPQLGVISAQLQLTGSRLNITVSAQDEAAARKLKTNTSDIAAALNATGTQLDSLQIKIA